MRQNGDIGPPAQIVLNRLQTDCFVPALVSLNVSLQEWTGSFMLFLDVTSEQFFRERLPNFESNLIYILSNINRVNFTFSTEIIIKVADVAIGECLAFLLHIQNVPGSNIGP
jgi:hypothetical protein